MKNCFLLMMFGLMGLTQLQGAADLKALQSDVEKAEGSEERGEALYQLAKAYTENGDHARALNQLEKVQYFIYDIQDMGLVNRIEDLYWKNFNAFNMVNPRQVEFDQEQKRLEEERQKAKAEEERKRLKAEKEKDHKPFLKTHVEAYRKALHRGRPRFRRRLSPLSMGHLNGLNTVVGVPELDSAYLLPLKSNWSMDFRMDYGFYKESSTDGYSQLDVDTDIVRGLFELTLPYKTFRYWRKKDRQFATLASTEDFDDPNKPFDLRIGLPVLKWGSKPKFVYDRTSPAKSTLMEGESGSFAIGDLFVEMKTALISTPQSAFGVKLRLKAPTGDKNGLGGTGSFDVATALLYSSSLGSHHFNTNLGYVLVGDSKNFQGPDVGLSNILFFGADFAYNLMFHHFLIASFDYHQNAFRGYTSIPVFDEPPMSLGLGYTTQIFNDRLFFGFKNGLNGASADQSLMITYRRLR